MSSVIQVLAFAIIGTVLLWLGYMLITGQLGGIQKYRKVSKKRGPSSSGAPGDPQVCPICSSRLLRGELIKTQAFPSITGGKDRLMYVQGCTYCLNGNIQRSCPVCGTSLKIDEILVARMFERSIHRNHVHILGCSKCRRTGKP